MAVNADKYQPIQVTETDEIRWDDCRVCSALMLVQAWTLGSVVMNPSGRYYGLKQIKVFREGMRNKLPADRQVGGLGPQDTKQMIAKTWPWLPPVQQPVLDFDVLWNRLANGFAYSVSGNPSDVKRELSKLRKWTINDDFGHEVFALRLNNDKTRVHIFDPLAPAGHKGSWVPKSEFRQFLYMRDGNVLYCTQVKIGDQSPERRMQRAKNQQIVKIERAHNAEVTALNRKHDAEVDELNGDILELSQQIMPIEEAYENGRQDLLDEIEAILEELVSDEPDGVVVEEEDEVV